MWREGDDRNTILNSGNHAPTVTEAICSILQPFEILADNAEVQFGYSFTSMLTIAVVNIGADVSRTVQAVQYSI
jgi:hypothetical protein